MIFFKKKEDSSITYKEPIKDPFKSNSEEEEVGGENFSVEPPKSDNLSFEDIAPKKDESKANYRLDEIEEIRTMINSLITQLKTIVKKLDELEEKMR